MRLRYALPILALSASVMLTGLGLARAQQEDGDAAEAPRRPGARRLGPAARRQSARPPTPTAPATPAGPAAPGAGGPNVQEFETGVDYRPTSPRTRVTFNLEDADLPDLVRLISNMTGKRFILPGKVRSIKATVYAPTEVTAAEAYNAFLSILEVNGMTVVPAGRYLKIAETSGVEGQPISTYGPDSRTPRTDRYVTHLHRVQNISAEDAATLLSRFKSRDGNVTAYMPTNMLIITDTGTQIRRMVGILESIDVSRSGEQVWIEPVHYANAADLAAKLSEIFGSGSSPTPARSSGAAARASSPAANQSAAARRRAARNRARNRSAAAATAAAPAGPSTVGSGGSRITNILSDERTNSLIILATESAYLRILEMVRQLDIPLEGEGRIHVHYVQHGNADEIADALNSLIGGTVTARTQGGASTAGARASGGRTGSVTATAASDLFEGAIRVTSYEPTNALIITSSLHDYAALRNVIERLDAPRRQVFIEAVIMELAVSRSSDLGISFHGGVADTPVDGALSILGFNAGTSTGLNPTATADLLTGMALGIRGPAVENSQQLVGVSIPAFGVVITALAQSGDINVLSTPHVMAMDNIQAEITVGENIPLQTNGIPAGSLANISGLATSSGQAAAVAGLAGGGGLTGAGGIPRQDVGTTLRFTPHINDADEIRLEIEEEISEAGPPEGELGVIPIRQRLAKTELTVRDQQTVVIGGLMREAMRTNESKVPILGDIPLIGALFRQQQRQMVKTNLLLFLTPYIIRDPSDLRAIFERKMRERQEFLDRYFVFGDRDYEPPVDYSRTRGLVTEIINELAMRDAERALAEAAQATPPPQHVPRPPVGAYERPSGEGDVLIEPEGEELEAGDEVEAEGEPVADEPEPAADVEDE